MTLNTGYQKTLSNEQGQHGLPPSEQGLSAATASPRLAGSSDYAARDEDVRRMLRFREGDERAFNELVERHKHRVYGVLRRLVNDREDIEDLAQEVFLRVFRSRNAYAPTARFSTWLYRIATNLAINAARKGRRLRFFNVLSQGEDAPATSATPAENLDPASRPDEATPSPEQQARRAEMVVIIREAIDRLPDAQRTAIILRRYEELSYDQIAEIMNLSGPAVKSLLSRARVNLRKSLARHVEP